MGQLSRHTGSPMKDAISHSSELTNPS